MTCVSGRDPRHHNVQRVPENLSPVSSTYVDGYGWLYVMFLHPVRHCVWCGLKFGYPLDLHNLPRAAKASRSELALCEAAQRGSR